MTDGITYRIINKKLCLCQDVGCPDFAAAARNRERIKNRENNEGYLRVENYLAHAPLKWKLPDWIQQGELPTVGKGDWRQQGGAREGLYELEN